MGNAIASTATGASSETAAFPESGRRRFATFTFLTALAAIAWHTETLNFSLGANWQSAATLVAFVVLILPASPAVFLALAAMEGCAIFRALPETNTNRLLQFFVFGTLTITGFSILVRNRFRQFDSVEWLKMFQPLLRLELLIVYVLAGWHKLNLGFFDAQHSCAVGLYQAIGLPVPGFLRWGLIAGTITSELGIPLLLTLRRTRNFGVWYGVAFHLAMGLAGAWSFSTTMIALLFLFAPDAFCDAAARLIRRPRITAAATALPVGILYFAMRHVYPLSASPGSQGFHITGPNVWKDLGYWLFISFSLLALVFYLWTRLRLPDHFETAVHCCRPIPRLLWIVPALLIFDGLTPYLGLKTETAFAMYSNLRTEGPGETNHLVWRHRLDLADYQRDLVRVLGSNDELLQAEVRSGVDVPFYVVRKRVADLALAGAKGVNVTFARGGKTITLEKAETDPGLASMPSWPERKLLRFRGITTEGCDH